MEGAVSRLLRIPRYDEVAREVASTLADASREYLRLGLDKLHGRRADNIDLGAVPQTLAGVFGIAIELTIKSAIAQQNTLALYKQVPAVVRLLASSGDPEVRKTLSDDFVSKMRDGTADMIDFAEAVECVFAFCPPVKEHLYSFLKAAPPARNKCVHSVLPPSERHASHRHAYTALRLIGILSEHGRLGGSFFFMTEQDKKFLEDFDVERAERVKKAISEAERLFRAGKVEPQTIYIGKEEVSALVHKCPVCNGDAVLFGSTDTNWVEGELVWTFFADAFKCDACGLELNDDEEVRLAGITQVHDRD
jgi:hypothetical protein